MTTTVAERSRVAVGGLWALQIISAGMFLLSGTMKLLGNPMMVQVFDAVGVGQWFRYLTGTIEVAGAVLVLIPSAAFFGAVPLALTMVGAILTHIFIIGGSPLAPMLLLVATSTIAWARRNAR